MTRMEIAERLHKLVDQWFDTPVWPDGAYMLLSVTFRSKANPHDDAITLTVGTAPADRED